LTYEKENKVYNPAFKSKAVALSHERANISELTRELRVKVTLLQSSVVAARVLL